MPTTNSTKTFDMLPIYFGKDYKVNDKIVIHQPTIGEILDVGEHRYYQMVQTITSIPSDMKGWLDDNGIDYEEVTDFQYFTLMCQCLAPEQTNIIFNEINFSLLEPYSIQETGEHVLADIKNNIIINEDTYFTIVEYLRLVHGLYPKREFGTNKYTKQLLIEESKEQMLKQAKEKDKQKSSILLPLISAMVNSAGFKYNSKQVLDVKLYEFMDSVRRINAINTAKALQAGCYSGNIDTTKINKKDLDWMRDLSVIEARKGTTFQLG